MYTGIQGGSLAAGVTGGKSVREIERDLGITAGNLVVLPWVVRRDDTEYLSCTPTVQRIQAERLPDSHRMLFSAHNLALVNAEGL